MKKKIMVLYSTAGMGHKKAAIAIHKAFERREEDLDLEIIDVLEYASKVYRYLYLDLYVFLMSRAKWLWAAIFYFSNATLIDVLTRKIRGILDFNGLPKLGDMLAQKAPDAIVATHFLLPSIAGILRKKYALKSKLFALITDYGPHSYWLSGYIDRFFVGSAPVSRALEKRGIPAKKIDVTGIATTDEFCKKFGTGAVRKKYGLDKEKKTIFLMSGGFGVGPIGKMLLSLNSCRADIQVITVCGHNEVAYENIKILKNELKYRVVLFAFTDKVAELMSVSDLMITKAGGISVTEALNARLPMILFGSMPGQEAWNVEFLLANGAAEKAGKMKDIPEITDRLLLSKEAYELIKAGIEKIRRPQAAEDIVDIVLNEIEGNKD